MRHHEGLAEVFQKQNLRACILVNYIYLQASNCNSLLSTSDCIKTVNIWPLRTKEIDSSETTSSKNANEDLCLESAMTYGRHEVGRFSTETTVVRKSHFFLIYRSTNAFASISLDAAIIHIFPCKIMSQSCLDHSIMSVIKHRPQKQYTEPGNYKT